MTDIVKHAPQFSDRQAAGFARDLYGIEAASETLPSERDQNFLLTAPGKDRFVLKIANATESYDVLDFQNRAMAHIAAKAGGSDCEGPVCPQVLLSISHEAIARVNGQGDLKHYIRLVSYLPGKPLAVVRPHDAELMEDLGRFFGRLDAALADFDHPSAQREFHWDLRNASKVVGDHIEYISDRDRRKMVSMFLERFCRQSLPMLSETRQSVIHNDGNDYNVLVQPHNTWSQRISGVIDFGDMLRTVTVAEPAILCAYAMMGKDDPLSTAEAIVGAYHRDYPLHEAELDLFFDLICMRLCTSVCLSAFQSRLEPDNPYLQISEKPAWALLERLTGIHPRLACYGFRKACGLEPVPQAHRVKNWLARQASGITSPVGVDLQSTDAVVLDLSVGSSIVSAGEKSGAGPALDRRIAGIVAAANATVGIGRYDEARLIYTASQFEAAADGSSGQRTIHLGLDFYLPQGSPVLTPLEGTVHSIQNNSDRLDYGPTIIVEHCTDDGDTFYLLYGHLSLDSLKDLTPGRRIHPGERIGSIGAREENGGWPPHLHFQIIVDLLGESGNFVGVAPPGRRKLWLGICPDPGLLLGMPNQSLPGGQMSVKEILALRRRHLGGNLSISYQRPLKIVRGRGQYLFCAEGRKYLDGVNNVCHVGHCHPRVVAAGQDQMAVLNTNTRYLHDHIVAYSQRLLAKFPAALNVCYFVCSGSEANELALRLARGYTGRRDIISVDGAYHGNTQALIDISPYKHAGPGGAGAPDWSHTVVMPDGYRGPYKGTGSQTGRLYADHVKDCIGDMQSAGRKPAAFICESLLGCGGQVVLPRGYLAEAFAHVRAAGGVCIVDEVQVGFGRAGSHFWAFETQSVVPDIVTLGKPIGNGHPLAAVITTAEIGASFDNGMEYFNTFGGNPVACAIGQAVLDVIEEEALMHNARTVGEKLLQGLTSLHEKYALVGDVRGIGLYAGVELVIDRTSLEPAAGHSNYIINRMRDLGILISTDGPLHNVLKFKPPLVFSPDDAERVVAALDSILQEDCLQVGD